MAGSPTTPPPLPKTMQAPPSSVAADAIVSTYSLAPTTRTTVVSTTTTTTTTTTFPPLILNQPRHHRLSSTRSGKEAASDDSAAGSSSRALIYPLADQPTPTVLRSFLFELDGRKSRFVESTDPQQSLEILQQQFETSSSSSSAGVAPTPGRTIRTTTTTVNTSTPRISDEAHAIRKRALSPSARQESKPTTKATDEAAKESTADSAAASKSHEHESKRRMTAKDRADFTRGVFRQADTLSESDAVALTPASTSSTAAEPTKKQSSLQFGLGLSTPLSASGSTAIAARDGQGLSIDVQAAQTANEINPLSLPSPSLSPVTGSLRKHRGDDDYFASNPHTVETQETIPEEVSPSQSVMMTIPAMVDSFDALPENVKDYVMYQFLRRCSKKTLSTVVSTVLPALRCDFIALLPQELVANVLQYLDAKTLCVAAQVSKTWKNAVDGSRYTWRKLLEAEGIHTGESEMKRAIREGWCMEGWSKLPADDVASPEEEEEEDEHLEGQVREIIDGGDSETMMLASVAKAAATNTRSEFESLLPYPNMFKAIYRHHYLVNRNWMSPNSTPRHLSLPGHGRNVATYVVTCLQFDSEKIITGSNDLCINVYDTKTGQLRTRLEGHEGGVWAMQYVGNTLVSGSTDRTVRVWDIKRGVCTHIFYGHTSTVRCLEIMQPVMTGYTSDGKPIMSPEEPLIVTGSRDSSLRIWKLPKVGIDDEYLPSSTNPEYDADPFFLRALVGHSHSVRAISGYGDMLVSGSYDTFVRVWKISTGECLFRLAGHGAKVYSVVIDKKRKRCISGSMDWLVKIWSLETGECLYTLDGHTSLVGLLDLNNTALVSAAADSTLRVWEPETGTSVHKLEGHTGAITCFQHDEHKVISGSDGTLKIWNIKTGKVVKDLLSDLSRVWQVRFDERRCVAAVQRGQETFIEVLDFDYDPNAVDDSSRFEVVSASSTRVPTATSAAA
ncbi:WD40-repeat-containing domain protein [Myxozyma melibiosi]|uniref:WD40-repeat-containing domain protein n=1 Tax=Myxozyma melibiosi TaxID=54550 RepID=A0ABR1F4Z0_9ASCO